VILRTLVVGLILISAVVLQTALFPSITLLGFRPDLLLLVVLAVGLHDGQLPGLRVGFTAGLMSDLLVAQAPVGLAILVYTGIGYIVGFARPYLAPESITAPVILAFLSGAIGTAGYGVMSLLLGDERVTPLFLIQASLTVALYNTLLAPIALGVVGRLVERFPRRGHAVAD